MGTEYFFSCTKCSYRVITSGGPSRGFIAFTDTYICYSCQKIFDITEKVLIESEPNPQTVQKPKKKFLGIPISSNKEIVYEDKFEEYEIACPECGSKSGLVKWNNVNRPCPRCGGEMKKNDWWFRKWD